MVTSPINPATGASLNPTARYYQDSGKIGVLGPLLMVVLAIPATLILGAVYGFAIYYIPFIYFNFFITLFYGGIVGYVVGKMARWGKVRNMGAMLVIGLLFGLLAEYVGWVSWLVALTSDFTMLLAFLFPGDLWLLIQMIAQEGAWSILGITPSGFFLWLIWGVEALIVIGAATLMAAGTAASEPYCERCRKWVPEALSFTFLEPIADHELLKQRLERGDLSSLTALQITNGADYTKVEFQACDSCEELHMVSVKAVHTETNSKGETTQADKVIINRLIVSPGTYETALAALRKVEAEAETQSYVYKAGEEETVNTYETNTAG